MTGNELARALRPLLKRRPFRRFSIEFTSGDRLQVSHPESVDRHGELFIYRAPDGGHSIFAASGVCQIIDPPPTPAS
jgi:hypothetical protein